MDRAFLDRYPIYKTADYRDNRYCCRRGCWNTRENSRYHCPDHKGIYEDIAAQAKINKAKLKKKRKRR